MSVAESGETTMALFTNASKIIAELHETHHLEVFLKECKSHVYRAPSASLKGQRSKGLDVDFSRFDDMLKEVFGCILEEKKLSYTIVQLCIVVAMLCTQWFDVIPNFDSSMETKEHKGPAEITTECRKVQALDEFIKREAERLHIASHLKWCGCKAHKFVGDLIMVHKDIIGRAMPIVAKQCCAYLKGVAIMQCATSNGGQQQVGTLRCSIVYGQTKDYSRLGSLETWWYWRICATPIQWQWRRTIEPSLQ